MSINMKMRSGVTNLTGLTCGNKCTRKLPTYVILVSIIYQADVLQFFLLLRPGGSRKTGREVQTPGHVEKSDSEAHVCGLSHSRRKLPFLSSRPGRRWR